MPTDIDRIEIADVQRLVVHPGETLVLTVQDSTMTADELCRVKDAVRDYLPDGVHVMLKSAEIEMEVVSGE